MDQYAKFADLAANERQGEDYRIRVERRGTAQLVAAPHGGHIEGGTSEIATAIAGQELSLYLFEGLRPHRKHEELHIKSELFDEPAFSETVSTAEVVVGVHGRKDGSDSATVWVGGMDENLRRRVCDALRQQGFAAEVLTTEKGGLHPGNICNRGKSGRGVQLEMPKSLRTRLQRSPEELARFASAIRQLLDLQKAGTGSEPVPPTKPLEGSVCRTKRVAFGDAFVEPFLYLLQQPRHPILAELYPLRELPSRLKPRNVLWRVRNSTDRFQLLLRYDLLRKHRTTPSKGSVDAPLRLAAPVGGTLYKEECAQINRSNGCPICFEPSAEHRNILQMRLMRGDSH